MNGLARLKGVVAELIAYWMCRSGVLEGGSGSTIQWQAGMATALLGFSHWVSGCASADQSVVV